MGDESEQKNGLSAEQRSRRVLLIVMGVYVLGLVILIATGNFVFLPKEVLAPALLIPPALSGRIRAFLSDWAVFIALVVLFDAFRGLVFSLTTFLELPVHMQYVISADQALLGGDVLPVLLQRNLLDGIGWFEKLLVVVHASHFFVLFIFGMLIWYWRHPGWAKFRFALLLLIYLGLIGYALMPTVPPWMAANFFEVIPRIRQVAGEVYNGVMPQVAAGFDTNPIAAMPSLHTAIPVLMSMVGIREFRWRATPLVIYTVLVLFGITYMGEHYLIDVLAGIALASLVYVFVYRYWSKRPKKEAKQEESSTGRSVFQQRMILAGVVFVLTFFVARGAKELKTQWAPTEDFIQEQIVGKSPKGDEFLLRRAIQDQDLEKAEKILVSIPMVKQSKLTLDIAAMVYFDRPAQLKKFADDYLAARPESVVRVYLRVAALGRRGLISPQEVSDAADWLAAQDDARAKRWAEELRRGLEQARQRR